MKGVKFRSYNTATARLAELTGMLPVQIEAAEISQAFATGVAESMISSGATGYDRKVWEQPDSLSTRSMPGCRATTFMVNKDVLGRSRRRHKNVVNGLCRAWPNYAGTVALGSVYRASR